MSARPICFLLWATAVVGAAEPDLSKLPPPAQVQVDFTRDVQPILENSCLRCHGPERPRSGFRLDNRESAIKGGNNGVAIKIGNSAESPLVHNVARIVADMEMPPEGKGDPLTAEQVGILRAWIDQGLVWGSVQQGTLLSFRLQPSLRMISVDGDGSKFREVEGINDGMVGGLEEFSMLQQTTRTKVAVNGHALFGEEDFKVQIAFDRAEVGFIRGGFEHWQRYYDDTGGYYRPFPMSAYDLTDDLRLGLGRAWVDFGLTLPRWPVLVLGYEYQFKDGTKSSLAWGSVDGKKIFPAAKVVDEHTHILKLDVTHEANGWRVEDSARLEFYEADNKRIDTVSAGSGTGPSVLRLTRERPRHVSGVNALRLERVLGDQWLFTGGYHFSRFSGDYSLDQSTLNSASLPMAGTFWSTESVEMKREAHMFNLSSQWLPVPRLSLVASVQSRWQRQESLGRLNLDEGDPDLPHLFVLRPAAAESSLDSIKLTEDFGARFTGIPFTVLFADARFDQETISHFEELAGEVTEAFLRDTDATNERAEVRSGFSFSRWKWMALSANYQHRSSETEYDHERRFVLEGDGYSAFIDQRRISTDGVFAKATINPRSWLKLGLTFRWSETDFDTSTSPIGQNISPGGFIEAGANTSQTYGLNGQISITRGLYLSSTFSYTDSSLTTEVHANPSVARYEGSIFSYSGSANYSLSASTRLEASGMYSQGDYGQNLSADNLPAGISFTRYALGLGATHEFSESLNAGLRYRFYSYSEPTSAHVNDYTAHGVFLTLSYRWN